MDKMESDLDNNISDLRAENEYLKSVVRSAENWQKRSWFKRTFHSWKKPEKPVSKSPIKSDFSNACRRPNFIIAGSPKAGTTSLYEYLKQHPDIFVPDYKEPTYFVRDPYSAGWTWDYYLALFSKANPGTKAVGEASPAYLFAEESAEWIKSELGNVKIILLLRDPAERAFSQYCWMIREGYEYATTFSEALRLEAQRLNDPVFKKTCRQIHQDYLYFTVGLYFDHVNRFLNTFGSENVKIYLLEDLSNNPLSVCADVFTFLGVEPNFSPKVRVHNEGRSPKSIAWQYFLRTHLLYKPTLVTKLFGAARLNKMMERNVASLRPEADPSVLKELRERYRPSLERLGNLLGRDLSHWWSKAESEA